MTNQPSDEKEFPEELNESEENKKPLEAEDEAETEKKVKAKKPKKKLKIILISVLCFFLVLIIGLFVTYKILIYKGRKGMTEKNAVLTPGEGFNAIINDDNTVTYNGRVYKYNSDIAAILYMGVDNDKKQSGGVAVTGHAGQADAIYLMVIDTSNGKTTVVGVPRDTMVDIDMYSKTNKYIGVENTQICLAYAYGDGKEKSCENTVEAVSRLFYGMPIKTYFSVDDKSIPVIHNAVGPITVIPNETVSNFGRTFTKGVPVKLTGVNVFDYLQARDYNKTDASYKRMERQLDYLSKYSSAALSKTKSNLLFPIELYNKIKNNAVTNIDVSKITYIASVIINNRSSSGLEFISLEGEQIKGEDSYAEFYPDEDKLFEIVLKLFYREVK